MHFTACLFALTAILASESAAAYNVTTPTQNFFLLSQRQLQNDVHVSELKISSTDERSSDHITLIREQQKIVLQEIQSTERSLTPLQVLSPLRRECILRYRPLLVLWDVTKEQFAVCLSTTTSRMSSLTSSAKSSLKSAKYIVDVDLPKAIATCNTTCANNQTQLEECVLSSVADRSKQVKAHLSAVEKNLESSVCASFELSREAISCSFAVERRTLVTIGRVQELIDRCMENSGNCSCAGVTTRGPYTGPTSTPVG